VCAYDQCYITDQCVHMINAILLISVCIWSMLYYWSVCAYDQCYITDQCVHMLYVLVVNDQCSSGKDPIRQI